VILLAAAAAFGAAGCLIAAALLLRRLGSGYRIARLLASAPEASLAEVREVAAAGERRYLRTTGRVSSDEEFPDENQRPLVFRRQRIERRVGQSWQLLDEDRLAVPFGIEDRHDFVAVDADALGDGLVVIPRESLGAATELPAGLRSRLSPDLAADTPIRLRVHQVSAVEHATVVGMPLDGPDGPLMTAGLGRPLILSTLEPSAAMRLLAGDGRRLVRMAAVALIFGLALLALATVVLLVEVALDSPVMAAEPEPSILVPTDPRSDGQGPGLVGSPVVVAMGVIVLGALVAGVTALVLRLTREG